VNVADLLEEQLEMILKTRPDDPAVACQRADDVIQ